MQIRFVVTEYIEILTFILRAITLIYLKTFYYQVVKLVKSFIDFTGGGIKTAM